MLRRPTGRWSDQRRKFQVDSLPAFMAAQDGGALKHKRARVFPTFRPRMSETRVCVLCRTFVRKKAGCSRFVRAIVVHTLL